MYFLEDIGNLMSLSLTQVPQKYKNTNYLSRYGSIANRKNSFLNGAWQMLTDCFSTEGYRFGIIFMPMNIYISIIMCKCQL